MTRHEFLLAKREAHFAFRFDQPTSLLIYRRTTPTLDPDFGNKTGQTSVDTQLRFSDVVRPVLKALGIEQADFTATPFYQCFVTTYDMEAAGIFPPMRERDFVIINSRIYRIESVNFHPQAYDTSVFVRFQLREKAPVEQDNGDL
jgi:hypothetical protein